MIRTRLYPFGRHCSRDGLAFPITTTLLLTLTLITFCLTVPTVNAQPSLWSRSSDLGFPVIYISETPRSFDRATDGGCFVSGTMTPTPGGNSIHPFLAKYDSNFNLLWGRIYDPLLFVPQRVLARQDGGAEMVAMTRADNELVPIRVVTDAYGAITGGSIIPHQPGDYMLDSDRAPDGGLVLVLKRPSTDELIVMRLLADGTESWTTSLGEVGGGPLGNAAIEISFWETMVYYTDNGYPGIACLDGAGNGDFGDVWSEAPQMVIHDGVYTPGNNGFWYVGSNYAGQPVLVRIMNGFYYDYTITWDDLPAGIARRVESGANGSHVLVEASDGGTRVMKYSDDGQLAWSLESPQDDRYLDVIERDDDSAIVLGERWQVEEYDILLSGIGFAEPALSHVSVWLYQPWQQSFFLPGWGGPCEFRSLLTNNGDGITFDAWAELHFPTGQVLPLPPRSITLNENSLLPSEHSLQIPPQFPAGRYTLVVYAGDYPDSPMSENSIIFSKGPDIPTNGGAQRQSLFEYLKSE